MAVVAGVDPGVDRLEAAGSVAGIRHACWVYVDHALNITEVGVSRCKEGPSDVYIKLVVGVVRFQHLRNTCTAIG